ncbi:hypothetical protein BDN72DRAFT_849832 [Pluteus cervinus]|uniref:Uncharacterized protein n=1 Tax=Pluteus cervinus TaxID=181527 RepID=A0ACD3A7B2_9AGAR|nr:hypothetical protein BDN72DRAFT_849832 [Pluteus cervinus]
MNGFKRIAAFHTLGCFIPLVAGQTFRRRPRFGGIVTAIVVAAMIFLSICLCCLIARRRIRSPRQQLPSAFAPPAPSVQPNAYAGPKYTGQTGQSTSAGGPSYGGNAGAGTYNQQAPGVYPPPPPYMPGNSYFPQQPLNGENQPQFPAPPGPPPPAHTSG